MRAAKSVPDEKMVVTTQPPSTEFHDPAWMVRRAWSDYRLPRLQEIVRGIIANLEAVPAHELLGREVPGCDLSNPELTTRDPVAEALRACCEELRDASGMTGAETDRAQHCGEVRSYIQGQPVAWSNTFSEALNEYRRAATRALELAFGRAVAA
jgi:hypothetical protein